MGNKDNKKRNKRRKFSNNQYTVPLTPVVEEEPSALPAEPTEADDDVDKMNVDEICNTPQQLSTSSSKINLSMTQEEGFEYDTNNFFFLMNFKILQDLLEALPCPDCKQSLLKFCHLPDSRQGFAIGMKLYCPRKDCNFDQELNSSPKFEYPQVDYSKGGKKPFEVNARAVIAFREIGQGQLPMMRFNALMNMPPPLSYNVYRSTVLNLHPVFDSSAKKSMLSAVDEIKETMRAEKETIDGYSKVDHAEEEIFDTCIGIDGSWQKRGHSSLNGVITGVSPVNRKVIDCKVLSKYCQGCKNWEGKEETDEYVIWKDGHENQCAINHVKSSGAMETEGALYFFNTSVKKYGIRYSNYLGDGDTNSFKTVIDSKPYGDDLTPIKDECVGHVQKRLGTRARNLRKDWKGKKLPDGKSIMGAGRLTDKSINKMQNYYGMAIRQNSLKNWNGDRDKALYNMKKCVLAVLWHCTDYQDPNTRHQFCPRGENSWCKYWTDGKVSGSTSLPIAISNLLKPIFVDLRSDELLSRCLDGMTQNPNESFNQIIWKKCPKNIFVNRSVLEVAVSSSILTFNEGFVGMKNIFDILQIPFGYYASKLVVEIDGTRIKKAELKTSDDGKTSRKRNRAVRKGYIDKSREKEGGDSYVSGNF